MALEYKDYYQILGVPRTASADDIKKAFRKLARQYHPDVAKDKKKAEEKFKEINEAHEVLGNPENRQRYDELGAQWKQGGGASSYGAEGRGRPGARGGGDFDFHFGGTGFSDFFEQFFAGQGAAGAGRRGSRGPSFQGDAFPQRGNDLESDLLVTLDEILQGAVRSVSLRSGAAGEGGSSDSTFRVRIPKGVQEGQRIRVAGKGEPGSGGAGAGDLILRVRVASHPDFSVRGSDLYHDLDLAPWEAVLGASLSVPTLDGTVTVKIPPGTNTGHQLRLKGRGLPLPGGDARGDLYVVVAVQVPSQIDESEKKLWQALAAGSSFKPRDL